MRTSLGIWALGPMITRFVPLGYQPEHADESTAVKVRRAVEGLGDLMDDYEFHYPGELNPDNLDEVRDALDGHGIATVCTGLHTDPRFGRGGLTSAGPGGSCRGAPAHPRDGRARRARSGANMVCWPGIEGYNYPFQTPYAQSWEWFIEGMAEAAETCAAHGVKLFLEHKNSEPAMKILMRNIGMTLHVIHKLRERGITNVQVNMDWQHLIMNGENLAEYAAMLAAEGLLGHQHANSGWGTFDDDNMVGATAFMETLELAVELRRANYGANGERLGFDLYPYTEDAVAAVKRSVLQWRFIDSVAGPDRRHGLAGGTEPQGRRPRLRDRVRGARSVTGTFRLGGDLEVWRLGFGAMGIADGAAEQAYAVLRRAVVLGVDLIDTPTRTAGASPSSASRRRSIPIRTASSSTPRSGSSTTAPAGGRGTGGRSTCASAVEASMRRLRLDRLDVVSLHRPDEAVPLEASVGALADLRDEGKIRHVGLSNVTLDELRRAQAVVDVACVQNEYNEQNRDADDVLAACEAEGIGFMPWFPLGGEGRSPRASLRWLLDRSPVMLPIPGTSSLARLEENMAVAAA